MAKASTKCVVCVVPKAFVMCLFSQWALIFMCSKVKTQIVTIVVLRIFYLLGIKYHLVLGSLKAEELIHSVREAMGNNRKIWEALIREAPWCNLFLCCAQKKMMSCCLLSCSAVQLQEEFVHDFFLKKDAETTRRWNFWAGFFRRALSSYQMNWKVLMVSVAIFSRFSFQNINSLSLQRENKFFFYFISAWLTSSILWQTCVKLSIGHKQQLSN